MDIYFPISYLNEIILKQTSYKRSDLELSNVDEYGIISKSETVNFE